MPSNETLSPAEIEAIGYLTGAVRGYERAGGSAPVIVVPVGYVRTLLAALAAQEAERRDSERLDWIFSELSLTEIDAKMQRVRDAYIRLWMDAHPEDFQARAIRDAIDAARQSTPTGATNE